MKQKTGEKSYSFRDTVEKVLSLLPLQLYTLYPTELATLTEIRNTDFLVLSVFKRIKHIS